MAQRRISVREIDDVLREPETVYASATHHDRLVILGTTRSHRPRRLKVVVLAADPEYVVTVADRDSER
jgi:hypothetical protein